MCWMPPYCDLVGLTVAVDRPDYAGRSEILKVHARGKTLAKDVDLDRIARRTPDLLVQIEFAE